LTTTRTLTRAENTRARLVEAAIRAFSEKGFHGTTTRDIAKGAGMSPAALYIHFPSKEEILYEIQSAGHANALRIVTEAAALDTDATERLRVLVRDFVLSHARDHVKSRVINYELKSLTPEHLVAIRQLRRQVDRVITGVVTDGVSTGVFRSPDPRMTAVVLESMAIDTARWFEEGRHWTPEQVADQYVAMAMRLVGVE
jgi:AcrR family transcriptional regulator